MCASLFARFFQILSLLPLILLPIPTFAQDPAGMPSFAQGLANFEARNLTEAFAPTGHETAFEAMPAEWQATLGIPSWGNNPHLQHIFSAWSTGGEDRSRRKLYILGGGHGDGSFNHIMSFELGTGDLPIGWVTEPGSGSATADVPKENLHYTTYEDGRPSSRHTYDGIVVDEAVNQLILNGGSVWRGGALSRDTWSFDFNSDTWTRRPDPSILGPRTYQAVFDLSTRKMFLAAHGTNDCAFYNSQTQTFGPRKDKGSNYSLDHVLVLNTTPDSNGYKDVISMGPENFRYKIDFNNEEVISSEAINISGDTNGLSSRGLTPFYDAAKNVYWVFGGKYSSDGAIDWITEIDAETFVATRHTITGDTIFSPENAGGTYKKVLWIPEWRIAVTALYYQGPASIIRLPNFDGDNSSTPNPPSNLRESN